MNKIRRSVIDNNKVSKLLLFSLGGFSQKVLIEGRCDDLPILITLHGGPGTPIPFSVGCRGMFPQFTDNFIMVYWDQLGCGINNHEIDNHFTINHFVQMTCDLIDAIKKEFPSNKLFIFSMSWGSILSLLVSEQKTELIDGVVASGQIVKNIFYNEEVYNALKENGISEKTMNKIKDTNINNVKSKDLQLISSLLRKKTNAYNNKKSKTNEVGKIILGLFQSPDYKFKDFKAVIINGYKNNISLWKEILHINLSEKLQKVNIPYFILQGETDIVASTKIVKEICESINNRNLQYKIIKNSGHFPSKEMMDELFKLLLSMKG
ncbi:alpha/beta fold hydrolase [Treponema sp. OMZ 792]|uniref:alpha/beta fold hydrolase n=1 Tax=unclassified Treponema TaxID=2638727 RepID=UPI0020A37E97|nr:MULTISPECIES: alpha/beta fold hydrolase [unclassified Treponema]UTC75958.1 alpha/beta fold hydrolase [Treponema sp. OMZ 792]UTC79958.1 alpha/beta fold hydrolase [Treponema sp. OMZ 798]